MTEPTFRHLTRSELDTALSWAAAEGWNPGLHDAHAFWAADPSGFHGMFLDGDLIGTASIVSYQDQQEFLGLFIVRPDHRSHGLGTSLARMFVTYLTARLKPGIPAALDGVFAMQSAYAKFGFTFTHRNLRTEGNGVAATPHPALKLWHEIPFDQILAFDARHFGTIRPDFLRHWLTPPGTQALVYVEQSQPRGLGVIRPCQRGFKIGPLFADTPEIAESLFTALSSHAAGQPIFLDIPECNPAAVALAKRHGLKEVFGCARMIRGPFPHLPWPSIYGITTFELG